MKTLLPILLLAAPALLADEIDQERLARIQRRFGSTVEVNESTAAGIPELPVEALEDDEESEGWNLFKKQEEQPMARMPQQMQQRMARRQTGQQTENSQGWLIDEMARNQEIKDAELAALEAVNAQEETFDWQSDQMSEKDIQSAVAKRLEAQAEITSSRFKDRKKLNPLKQLSPYKAMGADYLSPAQQMTSPDYTRKLIADRKLSQEAQAKKIQDQIAAATARSAASASQSRSTGAIWNTLNKSSALSSAPAAYTPQKKSTIPEPYTTPKKTIRDLKRLPSMEELNSLDNQIKVRRSIWDD